MTLIKWLLSPIAFALGFLTPLFAQVLTAAGVSFGDVPNLAVGLVLALGLGIAAQVRGGWLWHKL